MSEVQGFEEDDSGAVLRAVGRQIKLWREAAGMKQMELGAAIGYGEELVSAVERARRIPRPEFLDKADRIRDSKHPHGPQLAVTPAAWTAFLTYAGRR
ncbi:putative DNA-binding protein [Streptomyces bingchenggensis BCW-1]|uniref:Putative DNA-binding protein n=1 Tax=Streptomyces bingchenggensis (strain BCW-1) TaxID=749414 RepID=D7BVY3_STRBB|nr:MULTISPECIES: DUF397 domain-containing protein [Streptomyces]ADI09712.1 putative DNA-binding protein [Streptomyces bingchenggensis BCW-1]